MQLLVLAARWRSGQIRACARCREITERNNTDPKTKVILKAIEIFLERALLKFSSTKCPEITKAPIDIVSRKILQLSTQT